MLQIHSHFLGGVTILTLAFQTACTSSGSQDEKSRDVSPYAATIPEDVGALISEVDQEMEASRELHYPNGASGEAIEIPREVHDQVEKWLRFFVERDRERFQRFLDRAAYYGPAIEGILEEEGVPTELLYLAMIESGFETSAYSRASAVGIWQFIKPTAQRYGLTVNSMVDERRDVFRATHAAAAYLRNLNTVFQGWFLAMAAYNAGEARIVGAIMQHNKRDFWHLVSAGALPRETINYVPKFIAASIIGHNPERFGFTVDDEAPCLPEVHRLALPSRVKLSEVAKALQIPAVTLKSLNPHLNFDLIPDDRPTYDVWIPENAKTALAMPLIAALERQPRLDESKNRYVALATPKVKTTVAKKDTSRKPEYVSQYRVQRGDNLKSVARRFGVNVRTLKMINKLKRNHLYAGELLRIRDAKISARSSF